MNPYKNATLGVQSIIPSFNVISLFCFFVFFSFNTESDLEACSKYQDVLFKPLQNTTASVDQGHYNRIHHTTVRLN